MISLHSWVVSTALTLAVAYALMPRISQVVFKVAACMMYPTGKRYMNAYMANMYLTTTKM